MTSKLTTKFNEHLCSQPLAGGILKGLYKGSCALFCCRVRFWGKTASSSTCLLTTPVTEAGPGTTITTVDKYLLI